MKQKQVVMYIKIGVAFLFISGLLVGGTLAGGGGGLTGGATEMTQMLNNAELITQVGQLTEQINNQITMIMDMIENTMALPNKLIGDVTGKIKSVMDAYNKVQGVLGRLSNIDEEFYNKFYSSLNGGTAQDWIENYSEQYFKLSETLEKEAEKRIRSLKLSADDITDSAKTLEKLAGNANSTKGRNATLQATNEFLGFMSGELVKTRALMLEQTKSYIDYAERQRTVEDAAADVWRKDLDKWQTPSHTPVTYSW